MNKSLVKTLIITVGVAMVTACSSGQGNAGMAPAAQQLATITLKAGDASVYNQFPATLKGEKDAEIRPKVGGYIEEIRADEGSVVKKGQVLFTIDRVAYQQAVSAAKAAVLAAQASYGSAQLVAKNKKEMYERGIISQSEYQTALYAEQAQKASLESAKAQLTKAQNDLSFTMVAAPFDGVVGTFNYRVGSLVSGQGALPITTLADVSKMYAYFSIAASELKDLVNTDSVFTKTSDIIAHLPEVELVMGDGSTFATKGKVETMSAIVNPSTGAISLRAIFDNPDQSLRSGTFVNVRIPSVLKNVLTIPQSATYEQQGKKFAYVVQGDNTVKAVAVKYIEDNAGAVYYITGGLKAGDKVVVEGISRLRDGMAIVPVEK